MRARFSTSALVALVALATGALGIAVTLATTDSAKWPVWLRPYHRWGWWAVLALLLAAAVLSVWQYTHQARTSSGGTSTTNVQANDSGPAAGQDVTITGGQAPTAGRGIRGVIGGQAPLPAATSTSAWAARGCLRPARAVRCAGPPLTSRCPTWARATGSDGTSINTKPWGGEPARPRPNIQTSL
jgi:hypothetical protein